MDARVIVFGAPLLCLLAAACVESSSNGNSNDTTDKASTRASPGESEEQPDAASPPPTKPPDPANSCVTVVDIGNGFGGDAATPRDINERGQVVGIGFLTGQSSVHAFFWEAGHPMRDLGTLGGRQSNAVALNDRGETVGDADVSEQPFARHAALWKKDGTIVDLGTLGGDFSAAADINNAGQIVGNAMTATGETYAFLWENGVMKSLGTLGGNESVAMRINDRGQILGHSRIQGNGSLHAFLWENGVMTDLNAGPGGSTGTEINAHGEIIIDSGLTAHFWRKGVHTEIVPFSDSVRPTGASAINDRGQIVGSGSRPDGRDHGYLWHNGVTTPISSPNPQAGYVSALAINKHGQVAGFTSGSVGGRAFSWKNDDFIFLTSDSENAVAMAINDRGQIIGNIGSVAKLWETHRCHSGGKTW